MHRCFLAPAMRKRSTTANASRRRIIFSRCLFPFLSDLSCSFSALKRSLPVFLFPFFPIRRSPFSSDLSDFWLSSVLFFFFFFNPSFPRHSFLFQFFFRPTSELPSPSVFFLPPFSCSLAAFFSFLPQLTTLLLILPFSSLLCFFFYPIRGFFLLVFLSFRPPSPSSLASLHQPSKPT